MKQSPTPPRLATRFAALLAFSALLGSCSAPPLDTQGMAQDWANYMQSDYILRPSDQLIITLPESLKIPPQSLVVPPTGSMNLVRLEPPIEAVNRSVRTFRADVQSAYRKVFRDDIIAQVSLVETGVSSIYVTGEVRSPGPKPYARNMSLSQAIAAAGGFGYRAKLTDVRIVRPTETGKEPKLYRVNINNVFHSEGYPDFLVLPGDVIYCQSTWAGSLADTLRLYIWDLLPLRGGIPGVL